MNPEQTSPPVQQTGTDTQVIASQQPVQNNDALQTLIPYKNMPALLSYYFGVFGLIPGIGFPLTIVALVLGVIGLNRNKLHPESKGKGHAITGIVLGIIELVVFVVFIAFVALSN
jgi:hypothetical protein